jgi:hypothetical protein
MKDNGYYLVLQAALGERKSAWSSSMKKHFAKE